VISMARFDVLPSTAAAKLAPLGPLGIPDYRD
jgi:hypothetical protein